MEIIQKRTWAEIDLDAAAYNLAAIRERIGEKAKLCCVIKADAYGHGAVRLAKEYEALGADWLAISNIEGPFSFVVPVSRFQCSFSALRRPKRLVFWLKTIFHSVRIH